MPKPSQKVTVEAEAQKLEAERDKAIEERDRVELGLESLVEGVDIHRDGEAAGITPNWFDRALYQLADQVKASPHFVAPSEDQPEARCGGSGKRPCGCSSHRPGCTTNCPGCPDCKPDQPEGGEADSHRPEIGWRALLDWAEGSANSRRSFARRAASAEAADLYIAAAERFEAVAAALKSGGRDRG